MGALEKGDLFEANILADKIRLLHEHFLCVWVKELSNDVSTELLS